VGYLERHRPSSQSSKRNVFACDSCRSNGPENTEEEKVAPVVVVVVVAVVVVIAGAPTGAKKPKERPPRDGAKNSPGKERRGGSGGKQRAGVPLPRSPLFFPLPSSSRFFLFFFLSARALHSCYLALRDDDTRICASNGVEGSRAGHRKEFGWTPKTDTDREGRARAHLSIAPSDYRLEQKIADKRWYRRSSPFVRRQGCGTERFAQAF